MNHTASRTLTTLSYSDGMQYSIFTYANGDHGRRSPAQPWSTYTLQQHFLDWAVAGHYISVRIESNNGPFDGLVGTVSGLYDIRDADLSKSVDPWEIYTADDGDGWVSDDERDEDADGLSNYAELHGPCSPLLEGVLRDRQPFYDRVRRDAARRCATPMATASSTAPTTRTTTTSRT